MNASTASAVVPTVPGQPFEGGFFVAQYRIGTEVFALIAAGAEGELKALRWLGSYTDVPGARGFNDGRANTLAMAEAGSDLAKSALALQINGFSDWYLPARDELELLYRHLKPTTETNYTWRSGENPSALPATYPYEGELPLQTSAQAFQEGAADALDAAAYWSSTQYSRGGAWFQYFDVGIQDGYD